MTSHRQSRLFWSELALYEICPQQFLWKYGWEDIDTGGGPGKPKPVAKRSEHHPVMGKAIQKVLERAYNEGWFYRPDMLSFLADQTKLILKDYLGRSYVDPLRMSYTQMESICLNGVLGYLHTMRAHRLYSKNIACEFRLEAKIGNHLDIGGKPDFLFTDDNSVRILDGKNSGQKDLYTDSNQLRWYSFCHQKAIGRPVDQIGYVWYRYPYNKATGEEGVQWVSQTERDFEDLEQRAMRVRLAQIDRKFDPTPSPKVCRFCDYEAVCDARKQTKRSRPKPITTWFHSLSGITRFTLEEINGHATTDDDDSEENATGSGAGASQGT